MFTISNPLSSEITREFSETDCQKIQRIISVMDFIDEMEMELIICDLTFNSENTAKSLEFEGIDRKQALKIRNELAKQYEKRHPDWKYGKGYTPKTEEEKQLWKALKGDGYAYDTVIGHIKIYSKHGKNFVSRITYLLNSEKEENQLEGIRCLGFKTEEAQFLKSSANAIGKVLDAIQN